MAVIKKGNGGQKKDEKEKGTGKKPKPADEQKDKKSGGGGKKDKPSDTGNGVVCCGSCSGSGSD
jgi:hypothetical protein